MSIANTYVLKDRWLAADVWQSILSEARLAASQQPDMGSYFYASILSHKDFENAISFLLASRLENAEVPAMMLRAVMLEVMQDKPKIVLAMLADLMAHYERDAACDQTMLPLLYFKGFHALQAHRIAHQLWLAGRKTLAVFLQHRVNELFDVDIHPAAVFGKGIMLDHATGIVVGETSVVGDDVSFLHGVTLGGSGAERGDRHPKIGNGVLLSAGAKLLGNIEVGENARVGAGSLVLSDVAANSTVAGVPAKKVGTVRQTMPSLDMDHRINESLE